MRDPLVLIHQEVFHRHPQEPGQGKQVVHCGQALAVLPFVYSLRVLKPEVGLQIPNGQSGLTALPLNAATGLYQINDRICSLLVHTTILLNYYIPYPATYFTEKKLRWRQDFIRSLIDYITSLPIWLLIFICCNSQQLNSLSFLTMVISIQNSLLPAFHLIHFRQ